MFRLVFCAINVVTSASLVHIQLNAFFHHAEFDRMRTHTGYLNMNQIHPTRDRQIVIRRQIPWNGRHSRRLLVDRLDERTVERKHTNRRYVG